MAAASVAPAARRDELLFGNNENEIRIAVIEIGAVFGFERHMRIGSLEVTAALALVALLAARPRVRTAVEMVAWTPMQLDLDIRERGAKPFVPRTPASGARAR